MLQLRTPIQDHTLILASFPGAGARKQALFSPNYWAPGNDANTNLCIYFPQ